MEEVKKYIQHAPMAESKTLLEKIITQEDDIACDEVEVSLRSSPDSSKACLERLLEIINPIPLTLNPKP